MASHRAAVAVVEEATPSTDEAWAQLDHLDRQAVAEDLVEFGGPGVEARFTQLVRRHHRRALARLTPHGKEKGLVVFNGGTPPQQGRDGSVKEGEEEDAALPPTTKEEGQDDGSPELNKTAGVLAANGQAKDDDAHDDKSAQPQQPNSPSTSRSRPYAITSQSLPQDSHAPKASDVMVVPGRPDANANCPSAHIQSRNHSTTTPLPRSNHRRPPGCSQRLELWI